MRAPGPPPRRGVLSLLLGTRAGLEWFLLAAFPAIVVGAVAGQAIGVLGGIGAGLAVLVVGIWIGRAVASRQGSERE